MNNTYERQKDILKLISQLDISVTMYKNADEKYHAVAKFLEDCGIDADPKRRYRTKRTAKKDRRRPLKQFSIWRR